MNFVINVDDAGRREADGRLASAQTALMLQEETIRRNERERQQLTDKIASLERTTASVDSEKRLLQVVCD
jgi:rootletin